MKRLLLAASSLLVLALTTSPALPFCGFYVARADAKLYNRASQVAIARHDGKTVMTMANDFKGDLKEFAIVIPVPTIVTREQIHVADRRLLEHLDAYSAPRLVEYFDENPCERRYVMKESLAVPGIMQRAASDTAERARSLGVTIEAQYTMGEYDIIILSATQSGGLETWLRENGYRVPEGASRTLGSYIRQGMRFFVARVNLKEQGRLGFNYLRPIQVAYESPKFMLPIRLGMLNADGAQELFIYTLTRGGRVETTNYRSVKLPSDVELPVFVKDEFARFYRDMFSGRVRAEYESAVFLEYAWDMGWCDPCAADPLSEAELRELGVFWLGETPPNGFGGGAREVFVTRLHVRYDGAHFPDDLSFQETADRTNFQGRYILRHPWTGPDSCPAAAQYRSELRRRQERQIATLASLAGWDPEEIRRKMGTEGYALTNDSETVPWWKRIWSD